MFAWTSEAILSGVGDLQPLTVKPETAFLLFGAQAHEPRYSRRIAHTLDGDLALHQGGCRFGAVKTAR
jgi:hypothetical protein